MFAAAGGKQSMIRGVESQSGRAFAGTKFVSLRHCLFLWIDDHEFTRIFQVLINNSSCGVGLRIFRLSAKLHVSDYLPRISVDQRGGFAVVIPGINQIQLPVVDNGIRVEACGYLLQEL